MLSGITTKSIVANENAAEKLLRLSGELVGVLPFPLFTPDRIS
jgi:hypothetical protein